MRLLIVEDDVDLSNALTRGFREEGFAVDQAFDGEDGLYLARTGEHDLVVLDLMLPGMDGFRLLETLRAEGNGVPVVFLTARGDVEDRIRGLRLGGDDYLPKPFRFEELLARVRAVLRRTHGVGQAVLVWGALRLDAEAHRVFWGEEELPLTPKEFQILQALLLHKGKTLSRTRLSLQVYDHAFDAESNVIDAHVANLRRKLKTAGGERVIETVRGVGFRIPETPG
ncbi:response regulator transcription factor [Deferrisoma camini]|uniref:response regulator transcription factor n=1 Tax=Deferrisoma camini TaxID=1035120 RepID=UPI00046C8B78|nr:response regulator transcription factor [Deferrisoma camini]